jgi:WNK lysine deficient protein kinase
MTRNLKKDYRDDIEIVKSPEVSSDATYIRRELIGKGSFKTVYKAYNEEDGLEVAWNEVTIGRKEQAQREKITHEVQLLSQLHHPNIISFLDAWEDKERGIIVFITELMTSGTLRDFINNLSVCTVRRKIMKNFCIQILEGLKYLHDKNIIHRDLKCDNIFLNGNKGEVKIGDFGLSISKVKTYAESVIGTPEFMAPELYEEKYNEKVDIYSFGMCVLEMATGEYPYSECENVGQVFRKVTSGVKPKALEKVTDEAVKEFILACLRPADERPSSAELLAYQFVLPSMEPMKKSMNSMDSMVDLDRSIGRQTAAPSGAIATSMVCRGRECVCLCGD